MESHLGIGELIGTAALVLSALALWLNHLNRQDRLRSQQRASVSARQVGEGHIRIVNDGPADARDVRISVDHGGLLATESLIEGVFPIQTLSAGADMDVPLGMRMPGAAQTAHVTLTWNDDSEDGRKWRSNLRLF